MNQNKVMATLHGLSHQVGTMVFPDSPGFFTAGTREGKVVLTAKIYAAKTLLWSHAGGMCLLQGMTPGNILGPGWLVIHGTPSRAGDPQPGIRRPILAEVLDKDAGMGPEELFKIVWQALGLQA